MSIEKLIPNLSRTPVQADLRRRLIEILNCQGEIVPAAESPLGRLWELINAQDSTIPECVEVIELDPALTTRVFRLANSATFRGNATTIQDAVLHLGFSQLRQLVFSASIFQQLSHLKLPLGWAHFWIRNLFVARLMQNCAAVHGGGAGQAYLAGLIHDVGWLVLATYFPEEFKEILGSRKPLLEAEREILGFSHADISAAICFRSRLPETVTKAVAYHHRPDALKFETSPSRKGHVFLGIELYLCDKLADCCHVSMLGHQEHVDIEEIENSPEARWLGGFGTNPHWSVLVQKELPKAKEMFYLFFANHPAEV